MDMDSGDTSARVRAVCAAGVALQAGLQQVCRAQRDKIRPAAFCAAFQRQLAAGAAMERQERTFYWTLMTEVMSVQ